MMTKINECLSSLRRDERGLTTVEYAIVLVLIAAVAVGTWQKFGSMVQNKLVTSNTTIKTELDKKP